MNVRPPGSWASTPEIRLRNLPDRRDGNPGDTPADGDWAEVLRKAAGLGWEL
jgi:hypothetical protein